jgi:C4-dicarboxylate transporter DctQ subunit
MKNLDRRFERALTIVESAAILILTLSAFVIGTMQVTLRYVFNTGFPWSEGIFVMLTVWAMLLAGSRAVRDGLHVRVDIVLQFVPNRVRLVFDIISLVASSALSGYFAYCGYLYVRFVNSIGAVSAEAYLPEWIIYLIVPVAMGAFFIRYLLRFVAWQRGGPAPFDQAVGDEARSGQA